MTHPYPVQTFLISRIFPPFIRLRQHIGNKCSDFFLVFSLAAVVLIHFANESNMMGHRFLYLFIPFCFFMGIAIFCGLSADLKPFKPHPVPLILWFITGLFALLTALFVCSDYLIDAVVMLVIMPVFWVVWGNRSEQLLRSASLAFELSCLLLFVFNLLCFRLTVEYEGCFVNPNQLALVSVSCLAISTAVSFQKDISIFRRVLSLLLVGLSSSFIWAADSRAAELLLFPVIIILSLIFLIISGKQCIRHLLSRVVPVFLSVVLFSLISVPMFHISYRMGCSVLNAPAVEGYFWDKQPDRYTQIIASDSDTITVIIGDKTVSMDADDTETDVLQPEIRAENGSFLNERLKIWKAYLSKVKILGNSTEQLKPYISEGVELKAHNAFIQASYNFGWPAGICYLLACLFSCFYFLIHTIRSKNRCGLISLAVCGIFIAYAMIEAILSPVSITIVFLFYVSLSNVMASKTCCPQTAQEKNS